MESKIYFFALAATGSGLSGSDRIFIEFARRWSTKNKVTIFLTSEGLAMCRRQNLDAGIEFSVYKQGDYGFVLNYLLKILYAVKLGMTLNLPGKKALIYSASEFWMDSIPAWILKLRYPKSSWVAAWYQTAPSPLMGFSENSAQRISLSSWLYWLVQLPIKPLIGYFANAVLVNNENEKKIFPTLNLKGKVIPVYGAVDLTRIDEYLKKHAKTKYEYDAVFQGRFHPQKGVVELIEIWNEVVKRVPNAKLAMIGDGPLMDKVKSKINDLGLENNIELTGYLFDGDKKFEIFSKSKLGVHPSLYDSGGMASAEAMAFGIPVVGFDLQSYRFYYPRGMVKAKTGNLKDFAEKVILLLLNDEKRQKLGQEACRMIYRDWSWDNRADEVLFKINLCVRI